MPENWSKEFKGKENVFDPFLEYCCSTYDITWTGIAFMDDYSYLDENTKRFIRSAAQVGFRAGMGIPMRLTGAQRYGGFNLGTDMTQAQFKADVMPVAETLRAFCLITHRRIEELEQGSAPAMTERNLSEREKQCLTLLAGGP